MPGIKLNNWKATYPCNAQGGLSGSPLQRHPVSAKAPFLVETAEGWNFMCPQEGARDSGSPRMELRQTDTSGNNSGWKLDKVHMLEADLVLNSVHERVVIGQLKHPDDQMVSIHVLADGTIYVKDDRGLDANGDVVKHIFPVLIQMGQRFRYLITSTPLKNSVDLFIGAQTYHIEYPVLPAWKLLNGFHWKVGLYCHTDEPRDPNGQVYSGTFFLIEKHNP